MIHTNNLQQAKNQLKTTKEKPLIVLAQDSEFNRKILEYGKFDILLDIHQAQGQDRLRQLDSGLNHVLAEIAAKNNIAIGIDLAKLRLLDKKQKALVMARIKQNIQVCRKAKCRLKLINSKDTKDAFEFLISLGASTLQAKEAISDDKYSTNRLQ